MTKTLLSRSRSRSFNQYKLYVNIQIIQQWQNCKTASYVDQLAYRPTE